MSRFHHGIISSMKSYRKELWFNVPARRGLVNITPQVEECLRESGIRQGLVLVNASHPQFRLFRRSHHLRLAS